MIDRASRLPFYLPIRIGEMEVELGGAREEVLSTLDDLNGIVEKVSEAFNLEDQDIAPKSEHLKAQSQTILIPRIPRTTQCCEAVITLLSTEWG